MTRSTPLLAVVAGLAALVTACSSTTPAPAPSSMGAVPKGTAVTQRLGAAELISAKTGHAIAGDPKALAAGETAFGLELLRACSSASDANVTVSPASLALVLSMLQQGARGSTADELAAAMHVSSMTSTQQAAGWRALTDAWSSAAKTDGTTLGVANSVWQQSGFRISPSYLRTLSTYFGNGLWRTDFGGDPTGSLDAINQWVDQNTHGKITKLFDRLPQDTKLVLADAVYFKAAWQSPFDAHDTSPGTFTTAANQAVRTDFMSQTGDLLASSTPQYDAVELPYKGNRFSALAIMPKQQSVADFSAMLTSDRADELSTIVASLTSSTTTLTMPKFETSSDLSDLVGVLRGLGVRQAFTDDADFSGMGASLKVAQIVQKTYLKVAEKGTEAAAATGAVMVPSSAAARGRTITIDHPFLFLIRDSVTGALLFASQIENPAA